MERLSDESQCPAPKVFLHVLDMTPMAWFRIVTVESSVLRLLLFGRFLGPEPTTQFGAVASCAGGRDGGGAISIAGPQCRQIQIYL